MAVVILPTLPPDAAARMFEAVLERAAETAREAGVQPDSDGLPALVMCGDWHDTLVTEVWGREPTVVDDFYADLTRWRDWPVSDWATRPYGMAQVRWTVDGRDVHRQVAVPHPRAWPMWVELLDEPVKLDRAYGVLEVLTADGTDPELAAQIAADLARRT